MRVGIAVVFLWFGYQGTSNPAQFTGLVPEWAASIVAAETLVRAHGIFELAFGLLLLIGVGARVSAALLLLSLINTIVLLPYGAIMVRDIGIAFALVSIVLQSKVESSLQVAQE